MKPNGSIPEKFYPLSPWEYFGLTILYSIPVVGFVFLIVFSFSSNINKKNFTRSYWCIYILVAIIIGVMIALGGTAAIIGYFS